MRTILSLLLSVFLYFAQAQPCCIYYVDADAAGANTGASWADAFTSLQAAIDAADAGDQVWVAAGIYRPSKDPNGNQAPGNNRIKTFFIREDIKLYGGFAGNETALGQRNWVENPCILSGDIGVPGTHTDNAYHVLWFNGVSAAAVLDGFIIEHGYATGNGSSNEDIGAGVYINGDNFLVSSPVLANCIFRDNYCSFSSGAAVYVTARWDGVARPVFLQCQFVQSGLFSRSLVRHYVRARGVCEPVYRQCTFSRSAEPSGQFEITNHVEFGAPSTTTVHMEGYNTIIWNNKNAVNTTTGGITSAERRVDLANCLTDTLGARVFTSSSLIHQDPLFANLEILDLRLLPASPAIDAGNNAFIGTLTLDLGMQGRIVGGAVDIGAFEGQEECFNPPLVTVTTGFAACQAFASANASGGSGSYTYLWSGGQNGPVANGLEAGMHSVTVTDNNGCQAAENVLIVEAEPPVLGSAALQGPGCNGSADGQIVLTVAGGAPPFTYVWSDGQEGTVAAGLSAGPHAVTITGANGCTAIESFNLSEPEILEAAASETQSTGCSDTADGAAAVQATGGTPPYQYLWENGQTAASAAGLPAGLHSVTVTDANGCTASSAAEISAPPALQLDITSTPPPCAGLSGEAAVAISGGTAPYAVLWSSGQSGTAAGGLEAGMHSVTVTDARACMAAGTVSITEPPALQLEAVSVQPAGCNAQGGQAAVQALGGTTPYSYQWSDGQSGPQAAALAPGSYTATATDDNGCQATVNVLIGEAAPLEPGAASLQNPSCSSSANGQIALAVAGGTPPFAYAWSNGQEGAVASGLNAGLHFVTVTDASGCLLVDSFSLQAPYQFMIGINLLRQVMCHGDSNAAIRAIPVGGVGPFNYLWNTGQASDEIAGLPAGDYSVTITDANGCTVNGGVMAPDPPILEVSLELLPPSCSDSGDGRISAEVSGGIPPYAYQWSGGQVGQHFIIGETGTYQATVTDAHSCTVVSGLSVVVPAELEAEAAATRQASCPEAADGSAAIEASGGTPPYTYQWSNGTAGPEAGNLHAGTYQATVTDANGCEDIVIVEVSALPFEPDLLIEQDGNTLIVAEEDTAHYLFQWVDCDTGEEIPGAAGPWYTFSENGVYRILVTDSSGACRDSSDCVALIVNSTEALLDTEQSARAFPNPSGGRFTLALPWAAEALLRDASGRLLLQEHYGPGNHQVDLGKLPAGVYFLAMKRPEGMQVLRLIRK